jgi:hypothetical protein
VWSVGKLISKLGFYYYLVIWYLHPCPTVRDRRGVTHLGDSDKCNLRRNRPTRGAPAHLDFRRHGARHSRPRDDRLQESDMADEGGSPLRARLDRRARAPCDEGLGHLDIASAGEMIEMGAEIAVGRAGEALQARKVETFLVRSECGQRGHHPEPDRLVNDVVGSLHPFKPAASKARRA